MKLHNYSNTIFTIEDFLSKIECQELIILSEKNGYEPAKINTEAGQKLITQVRNNNRSFYNNKELAETLWQKAHPFVPEKLGNSIALELNELFRFYRYHPGQQFKGHFDESFIRNDIETSYLTFMVYLNDDFQGGHTTFPELSIKPKQGMALAFRHEIFHSGTEVTNGIKYVLRTDVMYRLLVL